jgi:membrane-associated protein
MSWILHPNVRPLLDHGTPVFLLVIAAILFAESGLLLGFFLPGDSLLFSAGLVVALTGSPNVIILIVCAFVAATLGDQVGYAIGMRVGPALYGRPDSRYFKQQHVHRTRAFFDRHGPRALVLARFIPVVRTFTPVLAGVSHMRYRTFVTYNIVGAAAWATIATLLGYVLGERFPGLENYLTPILLAVVAASLLPLAVELRRARRAAQTRSGEPVSSPDAIVDREPEKDSTRDH